MKACMNENFLKNIKNLNFFRENIENDILRTIYDLFPCKVSYFIAFPSEEIDNRCLSYSFDGKNSRVIECDKNILLNKFGFDISSIFNPGLVKELSAGFSQKVFFFSSDGYRCFIILQNIEQTDNIVNIEAIESLLNFIATNYLEGKNLQRKLAADMSQQIGMLIHDLKTPLATIKTAADTLLLVKTEEDREFLISTINKSVIELSHELENLITERTLKEWQESEDIVLRTFINELIENFQPLIREKNIQVSVDIKEDLEISASSVVMKKIFSNLLMNAIKFNRPNGEIRISATEKRNKVFISISDTGIGIPDHFKDKIFKRGIRGEHPNIPGTGLGTYIVKKLVEKSGGEITFESEVNKGTTFYITMPKRKKKHYILPLSLFFTILLILGILNFIPLIPAKPDILQTDDLTVIRLNNGGIVRLLKDSDYDYLYKKALFLSKSRLVLNIKKGDSDIDSGGNKIIVKTKDGVIKNTGTSFNVTASLNHTGISTYSGKLSVNDRSLHEGYGAYIDKELKLIPLLNPVNNITFNNLASGELEISWEPLKGAQEYVITIARDNEFSEIVKYIRTNRNKIIEVIPQDGNYFAKINGVDSYGLKGLPNVRKVPNYYHLTKGRALRDRKDYDQAIKEFETSLNEFKKTRGPKKIGRFFGVPVMKQEEQLELDLWYSEIAWTYYLQGKFSLAEEKFKEALKIRRSHENLVRLARIYYITDRLDEAIKIYEEVINENAYNIDALWGIGEVYIKKKNLEKALTFLLEVKRLDSKYPLLHYSIARIYLSKDDLKKAKEELEIELKNHPDSEEAMQLYKRITSKAHS